LAKYKKKRARELQQDRFRDTTMGVLERLGNLLEGRGSSIVYGLIALLLAAIVAGFWVKWRHRKDDEARLAMGRAISIATAPVASSTPAENATGPTFANERERAQRAIDEFQKVVAKYRDPYRAEARYFVATNLLYTDRNKGLTELTELSKSSVPEVATLSKFALAQAKEVDGSYDEAATLYSQIAAQNSPVVTPDTANLRLALVYQKQGKKKEAADSLFNIIDAGRKAKSADGTPLPTSAAARAAGEELQKLDPDRYAQLPPQAPAGDLAF
jgi:tetratricopeptide (TPR) repeat protein